MPRHAELPEEGIAGHPGPANDPTVLAAELAADLPPGFVLDDEPAAARMPLRFGRLALWMASASALGIGVLGTVGYGMWFTHDQRVYAEAMTSARRTLGMEPTASVVSQTQSAGVVQRDAPAPTLAPTPAPIDAPSLADDNYANSYAAGLATVSTAAAAPSPSPTLQPAPSTQAAVAPPKPTTASRASRSGTQTAQNNAAARHRTPRARPEPGLFARVGAFFHRVSYQRNGPTRQREEYSRP